MPRAVPIWQSFNAGELSPLLDGRTDQEKYFAGGKKVQNFIPTVQGPAIRRGGTEIIAFAKDRTSTTNMVWLYPFEFSVSQSYVLEFSNNLLRFYVNGGILLNLGVPYEVVTPYSSNHLVNADGAFNLRMVQSGDVMWIVNADGLVEPMKLSRLGATNWTLLPVNTQFGPHQAVNPANTVTVQFAARSGVTTMTMSSALLAAQHVGTTFYVETNDPSLVPAWKTATAYGVGATVRYVGNVYRCTGAGTSGSAPPVHIRGQGNDGGCVWLYEHSNWAVVLIQSIGGGGTTATVSIYGYVPEDITAAGLSGSTTTVRWAFAEFDTVRGWPTSIEFFKERLVYGRGRTLYMSVVGNYDNFSRFDGADVTKETALILTLASNRLDSIRWLGQSRTLLVGTAKAEISVQEQTSQEVFAADNAQSVPQTEYGASRIPVMRIGDAVLFVQRALTKLREIRYSFEIERYKADDLNVLSPHLTETGIRGIAFQQEPQPLVWCVLTNGRVAVLIYNRERGVVGWADFQIGNDDAYQSVLVESIASIPSTDGRRDDIWMAIKYRAQADGLYHRMVIKDKAFTSTMDEAFYVDLGHQIIGAGLTHDIGAAVGTMFDGTPLQVINDNGNDGTRAPVSGIITHSHPYAHRSLVGLKFSSILQTMRMDAGAADGTGQTRRKAIPKVWLRLLDSLGGRCGPTLDQTDPIRYKRPIVLGTDPVPTSNDFEHVMPANFGTDGYVVVRQDEPFPMTVSAIIPRINTND